MATPLEIISVFSMRQLSRCKVDRNVKIGDLAIIKVKDEPDVYNNYSSKIHSYFVVIKNIVQKEHDNETLYSLGIYEDGKCSSGVVEKWQLYSIFPIEVSDELYQKTKIKFDKAVAKEKKLAEEREEQRRRDEEQKRIFEENLRKQEEAERIARIQVEEERRAEPMVITVGMWEDLMKELSKLRSSVSEIEGVVRGIHYHCYGPGLEE